MANILKKIPEELKILEFNLTIENDGSNDWLDSTFLINDEKDTTFIGKIENIKIISTREETKELRERNAKKKFLDHLINFFEFHLLYHCIIFLIGIVYSF